jgi:hypothetical protein
VCVFQLDSGVSGLVFYCCPAVLWFVSCSVCAFAPAAAAGVCSLGVSFTAAAGLLVFWGLSWVLLAVCVALWC